MMANAKSGTGYQVPGTLHAASVPGPRFPVPVNDWKEMA